MAHVCPWWLGYLLASPLRRLWQKPAAILSPFVRDGMTVLEPGPGMGFFTLELARLVGPNGRVVAVDVQPKMLSELKRRATKNGLDGRIDARLTAGDGLGVEDLAGRVDFVLAFAMVHELPDPARFFQEAAASLQTGALMLLAEPTGHVNERAFAATMKLAQDAGLRLHSKVSIRRSHTAVLIKA
jgi:ubiquinone/menaquinone biosynthesis C-methylase UbiE